MTCTAVDRAGNQSTAEATYQVGYGFSGFAAPVDADAVNVAKAGRTIPLKFRVTDVTGAAVETVTSVDVRATDSACDLGSTPDDIEQYAGASGLQNLGDGYYQYNWSTPRSYANSCKTLVLDLGDGIEHTAAFRFTR